MKEPEREREDPETPEQWQLAVDAAHACLALDSAKQYGLIEGGPRIDVERCVEILEGGEKLGYHPSKTAIEDFIRSWQGHA